MIFPLTKILSCQIMLEYLIYNLNKINMNIDCSAFERGDRGTCVHEILSTVIIQKLRGMCLTVLCDLSNDLLFSLIFICVRFAPLLL